jgi:hypothetical protein
LDIFRMKSKDYLVLMTSLFRNLAFSAAIDAQAERLQTLVGAFSFEKMRGMVQALYKQDDEEFVRATFSELNRFSSVEKVRFMCFEMMVCRNVEAFDYYITQMLRRVFVQRPEILKASDYTIQMSEVLQCSTIDDVIQRVSEKKVQELSYKGLADIVKYLNSHLKLNFDEKIPQFQEALETFQTRNIIVHNACIVNEIYLQRTGQHNMKVGDIYPLTEDYFINATGSLIVVGARLDEKFVSHFKLT